MGTEALWIGLALSAASAGVSEANRRSTLRKQDRELAQGIRDQARVRREATQKVNEQIDRTEKSDAQTYRDARMGSMSKTLAKNRAKAMASLQQEGDLSDAARAYQAAQGAGAGDYAANLASLFSIIDAAGDQRRSEGMGRGDLGMDLTRLGGDASQMEFLARMRAQRHQDNPWLGILAAGLSGAGQGIAAGGLNFGGGAGAGAANPAHSTGGATRGWLGSGWRGP